MFGNMENGATGVLNLMMNSFGLVVVVYGTSGIMRVEKGVTVGAERMVRCE